MMHFQAWAALGAIAPPILRPASTAAAHGRPTPTAPGAAPRLPRPRIRRSPRAAASPDEPPTGEAPKRGTVRPAPIDRAGLLKFRGRRSYSTPAAAYRRRNFPGDIYIKGEGVRGSAKERMGSPRRGYGRTYTPEHEGLAGSCHRRKSPHDARFGPCPAARKNRRRDE